MNIQTRIEGKRGCGYRKEGGLYLVLFEGAARPCCRLPHPLHVCPTCNQGIKPTRGWTWFDMEKIFEEVPLCRSDVMTAVLGQACPLLQPKGKMGLIWVGEQFYPRPEDFMVEAETMGVSRRISAVPKDFKLGETWVALAHRKAITLGISAQAEADDDAPLPEFAQGIFHLFRPSAIEYVVDPKDTEEKLEALEKRGITLVRIKKAGELDLEEGGDQ